MHVLRDPGVETEKITERGAQDARVAVLVVADPRPDGMLQYSDFVVVVVVGSFGGGYTIDTAFKAASGWVEACQRACVSTISTTTSPRC